jgi:hypothetical protein
VQESPIDVELQLINEMDNIELFDKYINNELSSEERNEFDNRIKSDKEFSSEFKLYLFSVNGICREAEQDNIDFGVAIKNLTKEQLREIIGPRKEVAKPKILKFKPWMWQVASIAAVVIIAFTVAFRIERQSQYRVDDAIYSFAIEDDALSGNTRGGERVDVTKLNDNELKSQLPKLEEQYKSATDDQDIADNGYTLIIAYLRLHDRDNARIVLTQLIQRFENNEDGKEYVDKLNHILKLIE